MAKDTKEEQQTNPKMLQEHSARIDALWNKLQTRDNTKFITEGGEANPSPSEKEALMRKNIKRYAKENLKNNINSSLGKIEKVDPNFQKLSSKEAKVIDSSLKALDELKKVAPENPRPYAKVDSH
jgi:hypothetical protein